MTSSPEEVAWAGGFFKGEGCFGISRAATGHLHYRYPKMQLNNTDLEVLERFARIVSVGKITATQTQIKPHYKPQYRWYCTKTEDCRALVRVLWPWLGTRRREAADRMLEVVGRVR